MDYVTYGDGMSMLHRKVGAKKHMGRGIVVGGELMGGYGTKAGAQKNPWISYLRKHEGYKLKGGLISGGYGTKAGAQKNAWLGHLRKTGKRSGYVAVPRVRSEYSRANPSPAQKQARALFKRRVDFIVANGMSTKDKSAWALAKREVM